jgi:hypothetical protein
MIRLFVTLIIFVYLAARLPEDDAVASKHVAVLTIHKILLIYACCAFLGPDNKLCKMQGTCFKIQIAYS